MAKSQSLDSGLIARPEIAANGPRMSGVKSSGEVAAGTKDSLEASKTVSVPDSSSEVTTSPREGIATTPSGEMPVATTCSNSRTPFLSWKTAIQEPRSLIAKTKSWLPKRAEVMPSISMPLFSARPSGN
jgi:hypothetical protein